MAITTEHTTRSAPHGVLLYAPGLGSILDGVQRGALCLRDELQLEGITCRPLSVVDNSPTPRIVISMPQSGLSVPLPSARTGADSLREPAQISNASDALTKNGTSNSATNGAVELLPGVVPHLLLLDADALANGQAQNVESVLRQLAAASIPHTCILIGDDSVTGPEPAAGSVLDTEDVFAVVSASARPGSLRQMARRALDHCALQARAQGMEREVQLYTQHLKELNRIGVALSSERDLDTLLELILTKSRDITDADASSLYLVEPDPTAGAEGKSRLRFKLSQNDSLTFSVNQPMPISSESLAGYVALTGESLRFEDVYEIGPEVPYRFNRSFDESHGYRTKSMLVVPMRNHKNDIIGVLQLINRKTHRRARLGNRSAVEREVLPFSDLDLEMTESLASQAAVAIENSSLYQDIENLFEGFVTASARAIEQRDPTTSGHSERVAILTVELADRISRLGRGRFSDILFTPTQIKELRYAALLHDFGKVGVREDVLLKRNKLHEHEFDLLRMRFELVRTQRERDLAGRKVQALLSEDRESLLGQFQLWDKELEDEMHDMDEFMTLVTRANDPLLQWMSDEEFERQQAGLARLRHVYYCDRTQSTRPILNDYELRALSVRRGSLDEVERREIECHVTHTFEFLNQIPWTREYEMVPRIAYCHHERCNGTGYPRGLTGDDISLQARMMTIVDIYDALTASDRPYKKACTSDRAIDILYQEAQDGNIDRDVLDVFVTYHVWKLTEGWKKRS